MEAREQEGGGFLGIAIAAIWSLGRAIGSALGSAFTAVANDPHLATAGRRGADEIGQALKAFPDSVQSPVHAPIVHPRDAAAEHEMDGPSPSDIARDNTPYRPEREPERNHEQENGHSR